MNNQGLLFIPDISGFTRFVNETEIDHSRLILQELLEIIINENSLGLEISEIEGDAILFYKFGQPPSINELYHQVEQMFCAFHKNLIAYETRRYCQCKACTSAIGLTLKVITHFGEFTEYQVKKFRKLIGKDLIVAHQLLKNDIHRHEYWLITEGLYTREDVENFSRELQWQRGSKSTESGYISFYYTQLSPLKDKIASSDPGQPDLTDKIKSISISEEYNKDIITMFHATGDFRYRHLWLDGVKMVEEFSHFLPRVGMKCKCIRDNGEQFIYSSSYEYSDDKIQFSETDEAGRVTFFSLEKTGPGKTKVTIDYYLPGNIFADWLFRIKDRARMIDSIKKSLINLAALAEQLKIPSAVKG